MSHVAVLLTSERCGHCRNMRGSGRLLSKNEIKRENKQPNIPGGNYYDATFMKKLITAEIGNNAKLRVINIHYKTFNPAEGVTDISVFTLDNDGVTIRQTMLKEQDGKGMLSIYTIADSGKVEATKELPTPWSEIVSNYIPVNMANYIAFYPQMVLFEAKAWTEGIEKKTPIYGYINGMDTKDEAPYGAIHTPQPKVIEFSKFLKQFFDGSKEMKGPKAASVEPPKKVEVAPPAPVQTEHVPQQKVVVNTPGVNESKNTVQVDTIGSKKMKFKLYVVE
jgi:hypothetical protein